MKAQQSNTLFLLHEIPQSNLLNPAVQPECEWFIGIPLMNTLHIDYSNSSFTYNTLASGNQLMLDDVYSRLKRRNMISTDIQAYPISAGYHFNNNYYYFSIADRFTATASFSKKLAGLFLYGNEPFVGDPIKLNNNRLSAMYYREYSAGWAFEWDRFTSLGLRAKLLFGKGNFYTGSSRVTFGTDGETFDLTVKGNVSMNSSFPISLTVNSDSAITAVDLLDLSYFSLLMNPRNVGFAADFGLINRFNKEWTLSLSVLDLGMLLWTDDVYNIKSQVDFLYKGAQEGTDFSAAAYFRDLSDSLVHDIIYDVTRRPYISPMPTQVFLGAEYHWKKNINLGLVMRNVLVNRRIRSSMTASMNTTFIKRIHTSVSWTYMNNSFLNLGGGLAYSGRGLQVYAVSDNIIGLFKPLDARSVNLRFGMNILMGCPVNYNKVRKQEYSMLPCPTNQLKRGKFLRRRR
ncbi:DUF5723 family protein [Bacteroidota bacterium]